MKTPFWFIDIPSVDSRIAIAGRHGDSARVVDAVLRAWDLPQGRERDALYDEATRAEGDVHYVHVWDGEYDDARGYRAPTPGQFYRAVGLSPSDDLLGLDLFTTRTSRGFITTSAPAVGDLDAGGACRCGCGYVAPRPPEFTNHSAAI